MQKNNLNDILDIEEPQTTRGTRFKSQPNNSSPSRVGWRRGSSVHGSLVRCESEGVGSSEDIKVWKSKKKKKSQMHPRSPSSRMEQHWGSSAAADLGVLSGRTERLWGGWAAAHHIGQGRRGEQVGGGGGGGVCQEGWLARRRIGRSRRNKESLRRSSFLAAHFSASRLELLAALAPHLDPLHCFFFSILIFQVSISSHPHVSAGLSCLFFPPFIFLFSFFCLVLYLSPARSLHSCLPVSSQWDGLACDVCQSSRDCATLPGEWESNTDSGAACQEDGTAVEPMATENVHYIVCCHLLAWDLFPSDHFAFEGVKLKSFHVSLSKEKMKNPTFICRFPSPSIRHTV